MKLISINIEINRHYDTVLNFLKKEKPDVVCLQEVLEDDLPFQVVDFLLKSLDSMPEFVLCGDTNAPRGNETFSRLATKYKDNIPAEYKTSIDQKLHRVKGIMFMVDGLFTTSSCIASNVRLQDGVSDHMAVLAEIEKSSICFSFCYFYYRISI